MYLLCKELDEKEKNITIGETAEKSFLKSRVFVFIQSSYDEAVLSYWTIILMIGRS